MATTARDCTTLSVDHPGKSPPWPQLKLAQWGIFADGREASSSARRLVGASIYMRLARSAVKPLGRSAYSDWDEHLRYLRGQCSAWGFAAWSESR